MKLKTTAAGTGDYSYELIAEDTYPAVCVGIIDLGTQPPSGKFLDQKPQRKVYMVWELSDEATRPLIARDYTASLGEKANLRKVAEALAGRTFGKDEEIELDRLLGRKCLLQVKHTGGEKKYHNVGAITAAPKKLAINDAQVKPFSWWLESGTPYRNPSWDVPYWYGKPIDDAIKSCAELANGGRAPDADLMGDGPTNGPKEEVEEAPF